MACHRRGYVSEGLSVVSRRSSECNVASAEWNGGGLSTYIQRTRYDGGRGGLMVRQRGIMRKKRGNLKSTIIRIAEAISG